MTSYSLKKMGLLFWCIGMVCVCFDFVAIPLFSWKASVAYPVFFLSAVFVYWAEKKIYSTRGALYRLHDVIIYSPFRFLFLYFLWAAVFTWHNDNLLTTLVFAANGWFSLLFVAVTAQLIFCERTEFNLVLVPHYLKVAFQFYAGSIILLMCANLAPIVIPWLQLPKLLSQQVNLFIYFSLGLPFLIWDFAKAHRSQLGLVFSGIAIFLGLVNVLLVGRIGYLLSIFFIISIIVALFVFKKIRLRPQFFLKVLIFASIALASFGAVNLFNYPLLVDWRSGLEAELAGKAEMALAVMQATKGLGSGIGISQNRGIFKVVEETGAIGTLLFLAFFVNLLRDLFRVRHSQNLVVSNVALISVLTFVVFVWLYVENPYGAYVWIWYSLWGVFASTYTKKRT